MVKSTWYSKDYLLEEKNSFYRKLLNRIPDLIFQLTIDSDDKFYFSYVNSTIVSFFEITENELLQNPKKVISSKIFHQDREGFFNSIHQAKREQKPWSYEFRVQINGKPETWLKVDAEIEINDDQESVFFGRLTDINDIKKREFEVKASEERYHFALEASKSGVWDYNLTTGDVFFSKESLAIIGFTETDGITTNDQWDSRIHPEDLSDYRNDIELHMNGKTGFFENSKRILSRNGVYKWVLSRGKVIARDVNNNAIRIIGTHTDVTLEKEKEVELLGNLDIINEQNNRLLNFAHIVSHNLRSHTGNLKMLLNIIESDDDQETKEECFNHLRTTSEALSDTIEHLKELVDIHSTVIHKKENLNLNSYLNRTLEILSNEIKENKVDIVNEIDNNQTVKFNPAYLDSIFLNFTTNAIKYSHPDRIPVITYSFKRENKKGILSIHDNGLGINLEKYGEKLFGMYKTFHKNQNARGIGLFITKNQVESMGGTIEVESKVNQGTTFKINFNEEV